MSDVNKAQLPATVGPLVSKYATNESELAFNYNLDGLESKLWTSHC